jgi:hypothetical protein
MIFLAIVSGSLSGALLAAICSSLGISYNVSAWIGIILSAAVAVWRAIRWERKSVANKSSKPHIPLQRVK